MMLPSVQHQIQLLGGALSSAPILWFPENIARTNYSWLRKNVVLKLERGLASSVDSYHRFSNA